MVEQQRPRYLDSGRLAAEIREFIMQKASAREPFSIIRLGDGEGCLLFRNEFAQFSQLASYVEGRISDIIFGDQDVVVKNWEFFYNSLVGSIIDSDIVGISPLDFVQRRLDNEQAENVDVRAVCGVKAQVHWLYSNRSILFKGGSGGGFSDAWLSRHLLPHYAKIIGAFPNVAVITGNADLHNFLRKAFSIESIVSIGIPTQRALKISHSEENVHFPNRFVSVLKEIERLPENTLVLVAAGLLGKAYCSHAKKHGSSAIDIGSVADIWCGTASRPGVKDEFIERWRIDAVG